MKYLTARVILLLFVAAVGLHAARNFGGEVAVLYTTDNHGKSYRTDLWVIGQESNVWIRATNPSSDWLDRVINNPDVELRRGEILKSYKATPLTRRRTRINSSMAEAYGWAEWLLAKVEDRSESVPVYLDPFG